MNNDWDLNEFSKMLDEQSLARAKRQTNGREVIIEAENTVPFSDEVRQVLDLIDRLQTYKNICEFQGIETEHKNEVLNSYIELRQKISKLLTSKS